MEQHKVFVQELTGGMYVAALDRPWLETPFKYQGFLIQTDNELQTLRALCDYVFVDVERSQDNVADNAMFAGLPQSATQSKSIQSFRQDARKAESSRKQMYLYLGEVYNDVRLGKSLSSRKAKDIVGSIVDNISTSANAALWLTNLRRKDEYTTMHSMNVCVLTLAFCRHLNFSQSEMEVIGLGALLHDIGKTKTPDAILNKRGPLTRDEYSIMQRHPEDGYKLMMEAGGVPHQALSIIRLHHERVSGLGYPQGLKGNSIVSPILMTAIADVYDAITSDRSYHVGLSSDLAMQTMYEGAEGNFGKELVQEFIKCIGIYPAGCLVEMVNGNIGMVLSAESNSRLKPMVLLLKDANGKDYEQRELINLEAMTGMSGKGWSIRRVVTPAEAGINSKSIILSEINQKDD